MNNGHGTIGKFIKDPSLYDNANKIVASGNQLIADINAGKGTLGRLAKDEELARKIDSTITRLNNIADRLDKGRRHRRQVPEGSRALRQYQRSAGRDARPDQSRPPESQEVPDHLPEDLLITGFLVNCAEQHLYELERQGDAVILRLVSTDAPNRLTRGRVSALTTAVEQLASEPPSRLLITGNAHFFSAGADLNEIAALTGPEAFRFAHLGQRLMNAVASFPAPTIAAVHGYCMGGGLDLAFACQRRIAGPHALFGHRGAALGLITGWGGTQRLPRLIGKSRALQMFLAAEKVHARQALRIGLVDAIADDPVKAALQSRAELSAIIFLMPVPLPPGDQKLVQIIDAALADTARRSGEWLVCKLGCTQCCIRRFRHQSTRRATSAARTRRYSKPRARTRRANQERARDSVERLMDEFPGDPQTGVLDEATGIDGALPISRTTSHVQCSIRKRVTASSMSPAP